MRYNPLNVRRAKWDAAHAKIVYGSEASRLGYEEDKRWTFNSSTSYLHVDRLTDKAGAVFFDALP